VRLPWTIWRYTLLDLWRLLLLTTAILVAVISFAATVRHIADGRLGPIDTIKFMFMAMPPMLLYALPFAAGFAATLSYHRMSEDNELRAAAASGVSHRALLAPALVTGLILVTLLTGMSGWVIPGFLRGMERMITRDAAKLVVATIESGRPLEYGLVKIHADRVRPLTPPPSPGASEALLLTGVFAIVTDKGGDIVREATANQAVVEFFRGEGDDAGDDGADASGATNIHLTLTDASYFDRKADTGSRVSMGGDTVSFYWAVPSFFDDNPKYLTMGELRDLPDHPDRLNIISSRKHTLAVHIAERDTIAVLRAALQSQKSARLSNPVGETLILRAAGVEWNPQTGRHELQPRAGAGERGIEVEVYPPGPGGRPAAVPDLAGGTRLSAATGGLKSSIGRDRVKNLTLTLDLESVATRARDLERGGELTSKSFAGLSSSMDPLPALLDKTSAELLDEVDRRSAATGADEFLAWPANDLRRRLEKLGREVIGHQNERLAMSLACLVMVLAGALTAMRLGSTLPLGVYLWSFFPALIAVLTISAGQQMTRQMGLGGLGVLWGGVAALAAYAGAAFAIVRRH